MTTTTLDPVKKIEQAFRKLEQARQLVADDKVLKVLGMEDSYAILSSKGIGAYVVELEKSCTCPDFINRGADCKHLLAAYVFCQQGAWESQEEYTGPSCEISDGCQGEVAGHPYYGSEIFFCDIHGAEIKAGNPKATLERAA